MAKPPSTAFKKGCKKHPLSGRKKGQLNKETREVRAAIESVYNRLGGDDFLYEFALKNPQLFLERIWIKILPVQVNANINVATDFSHILEAARNRTIEGEATTIEINRE